MAKIQALSPHLADLIAAGEVVERPASCAKELVENSIDAGATRITVEIQNGGMTYLRVTDDGCGIDAEDVETAFLRHATSKLRSASDLESIKTLGFRGEALAAISAVSRMDVLTKTAHATFGTSIHLEAGKVTERGEAGCPTGTTMIVRDLFFNTPARMKFMKSDSAEASALISSMQKLALAHPEVSLRVLKDGQLQFQTPGDGSLYNAIYGILGKLAAKDMIPVESRWEKYTLTGYVSKGTATRGNRSLQIFFVNGRLVRSKSMTVALEEAYRNRIMGGRFPYCVLHLQMPEHLVDVNVHPAKVEVKFLNERDVFDTIRYGVEGALEKATDRPEMKLGGSPSGSSSREAPTSVSSPVGSSESGSLLQGNPATGSPRQDGSGPWSSRGDSTTIVSSSQRKPGASLPLGSPKGDFFRTMTAEEYRQYAKAIASVPPAAPSKTVERQLSPISSTVVREIRREGSSLSGSSGLTPLTGLGSLSLSPDSSGGTLSRKEDDPFSISISDVSLSSEDDEEEAPYVPDSRVASQEAPVEGAAPIAEKAPTWEATPAEEAVPVRGDVLVGKEVSVEEDIPTEKESPVEGNASIKEAIPVQGDGLSYEESLLPQDDLSYRLVGEVLNTYIIVEQDKTLLFIDKHAAHERILFEKLRARQEPVMSQLLLTPILFTPEREEGTVLLENEEMLTDLGFGLSDYGDGTLAINSIPADLSQEDGEATLNILASQLLAGKRLDPSVLRDELLHTVACKAAVKGGQLNRLIELDALVKEVLSREDLKCCPHGRPICITMSASQLERQFKR